MLRRPRDVLLPGITHWNHPGFFAYFATTGSAPGILAELLAAALNVNGMLWRTSPAATELEEVTLDWLRQLLGLPAGPLGVIQDTASASTLVRRPRRRARHRARRQGPCSRSEYAHSSSVEKAGAILGSAGASRKIPADAEFRLTRTPSPTRSRSAAGRRR